MALMGPLGHRGDPWDLVRRAQGGDMGAFGDLYAQHRGAVFRFLLPRAADWALAEDLTADTFLSALAGIGSVAYQGRDFGAWLTVIARNTLLDHVKARRVTAEISAAALPERPGPERGPEDIAVSRDTAARVREAVAGLSDEQRQCVSLRFFEDRSLQEVAAAMGRATGAVKALQNRAFTRLRDILGDGAPAPGTGRAVCVNPGCRQALPTRGRGLCCSPRCERELAAAWGEPLPGDRCHAPGCGKHLTTSQRRHGAIVCGRRCMSRVTALRKTRRELAA